MRTLDEGGRRRSTELIVPPPTALAHVVEALWIDEWTRARPAGGRFRIVADGSPHLIWHSFSGKRREQMLNVVGARRAYHDVNVSRRTFTVGVRLRPGALSALLGRSAEQFTDRSLPLASVIDGRLAADLRRMRPATAETALIQLLSTLERLAGDASPIDWRAVWLASRNAREVITAASAAESFGLGDRGLRAWSARSLGMGLKHFLKIRRLHTALQLRMSGREQGWSRVAADAGYADQSHLVRDCRALLGETPVDFVSRSGLSKRGRATTG